MRSVYKLHFLCQMAFADGSGPQGEVWTTYTDVSGLRFGIIFVANLTRPYKIGPSLTGFSPQVDLLVAAFLLHKVYILTCIY